MKKEINKPLPSQFLQGENILQKEGEQLTIPTPPAELVDETQRRGDKGPFYSPISKSWFAITTENCERCGH